jgi:hypothetical protein
MGLHNSACGHSACRVTVDRADAITESPSVLAMLIVPLDVHARSNRTGNDSVRPGLFAITFFDGSAMPFEGTRPDSPDAYTTTPFGEGIS